MRTSLIAITLLASVGPGCAAVLQQARSDLAEFQRTAALRDEAVVGTTVELRRRCRAAPERCLDHGWFYRTVVEVYGRELRARLQPLSAHDEEVLFRLEKELVMPADSLTKEEANRVFETVVLTYVGALDTEEKRLRRAAEQAAQEAALNSPLLGALLPTSSSTKPRQARAIDQLFQNRPANCYAYSSGVAPHGRWHTRCQ